NRPRILDGPPAPGERRAMPTQSVPSLVESLSEYVDGLPADARADALHQVFYGFYARVAIIDRTAHDLAAAARAETESLEGLPAGSPTPRSRSARRGTRGRPGGRCHRPPG